MNSSVTTPVQQGDVLDGKYEIGRVIGRGGMAVVVQARHLHLGEPVALKFMNPGEHRDPVLLERFLREARAAVRIKSPHVARVLDVAALRDGTPYLVMEYLEGTSLDHEIATRGPLGVEIAAGWLIEACEAIAEAHALGIVHRDLKPGNLFVTRTLDGQPIIKVLDFGISKLVSDEPTSLTLTSPTQLLGSPAFMSPEQLVFAKGVDGRADIWALGAIFYQCITGLYPFPAVNLAELSVAILSGPTPRLPPLAGTDEVVERTAQAIIDRALQKRPTDRYGDVGELAAALAGIAPPAYATSIDRIRRLSGSSGREVTPVVLDSRNPPHEPGNTEHAQTTPHVSVGPKRRARAWLLAGALALGAAALAGVVQSRGKSGSDLTTTRAAPLLPAERAAPRTTEVRVEPTSSLPPDTAPAPPNKGADESAEKATTTSTRPKLRPQARKDIQRPAEDGTSGNPLHMRLK